MARLSKHGHELLRVRRESDVTRPDALTSWECVTRAYMSDGTVLQKHDVRWKPDTLSTKYGASDFHSYGWKIWRKTKAGVHPEDVVIKTLAAIAAKPDTKWEVVSGGLPPVVLEEKRVLAAVERNDGSGFCKACGAETDGVEPDARGYRCEECGQDEVYGAEECLI